MSKQTDGHADERSGTPTRRTAIAGLAAGGAAVWVAPLIISQPAASAATGAPTVAHYINAGLLNAVALDPNVLIPFGDVRAASGLSYLDGVVAVEVAGVYRVAYGLSPMAQSTSRFQTFVNGTPRGMVLQINTPDTFGSMEDLLVLNAGDVVKVCNVGTEYVQLFPDNAWLSITEL